MNRNTDANQVVMGRKMFDELMTYMAHPLEDKKLEALFFRHLRKFNPKLHEEHTARLALFAKKVRDNRATAIALFREGQKLSAFGVGAAKITQTLFGLKYVVDAVPYAGSLTWNSPVRYLRTTITVGGSPGVGTSVYWPIRVTRIRPGREKTLLYVQQLEMKVLTPSRSALLDPRFKGWRPIQYAVLFQRDKSMLRAHWVDVEDIVTQIPPGWVTVSTGLLAGGVCHPSNYDTVANTLAQPYSLFRHIESKHHAD